MRLLALGVDHRSAPATVREALAFGDDRLDAALRSLQDAFPGSEFVVLSTCNRVEIYAAGPADAIPDVDALSGFFADFHGLHPDQFAGHLVGYHDEAAVGHLFRVAASLESLVLGEGQILGQVREAYRSAVDRKAAGPVFHAVFQNALRVGKLVREKTGMDQGKLSVASVAVDLAREVFDTFTDKTVLVIGAGKMGDLTLQHLKKLEPGRILIVNRNAERAEAAAERWRGRAVPFDSLGQALVDADLVISTTAAAEPIMTLDQYVRVQRARRNRLSLILDIAIPRDFDPRIGDLDQVTLYNVDDLRAQAEQNLSRRRRGVDPALQIIERETAACYAAIRRQQDAGVLLRQLGDRADQIRRRELDHLFGNMPQLSDADREAIAHMAARLQNQFLHHPRAAVRTAAAEAASAPESPHPILTAVRHLFGLTDSQPQASLKKIT
ncbi:glutamyl-tRNA reductase [Planctomyces sp. SH-PL62]|uniref:glutamyl-tRNA reductase n=1 Tax=Planctomyces sp. SH-PL62 TaxID=1636152 RepID=UPI00078DC1D9|nr:glutamyl-tRNA reductase [Planctomyces sp. SH-PL62]AMV35864.1 Glutamyl-tRNA reductase [Planctomyces sp. SH-PL62]